MSDIDELEAKAKAATQGSWGFSDEGHLCVDAVSLNGNVYTAYLFPEADLDPDDADVQYIAACSPDVILDLIRRVREAEALSVKLADGLALVMHERDEALANLATMTRVYERACDSQVEAQRERDEARAERDAAIASVEAMRVEMAKGVRLDRHHAVTAMCALEFHQEQLVDEDDIDEQMDDVIAAMEHLEAALREHARKAGA